MGNKHSIKKRLKELDKIFCPFCKQEFSSSYAEIFNMHTKRCGLSKINLKACDSYPPGQDIILNELIFKNSADYLKKQRNNIIDDNKSLDVKLSELKDFFFEKKNKNLEHEPNKITINRQNLLKDAMNSTANIIDIYKDWKIYFVGEVSFDVGGLLREFFTNTFQVLESEEMQLFIRNDGSEVSFNLNPFLIHNTENFAYCKFIGLLMAKALIQNVTINICFNKLIYKMILEEKISFDDLQFIDSELYNSLRNLKDNIEYNNMLNPGNDNNIIKDLGLSYTIEMKDNKDHIHTFELIENGRNVEVENLDHFIEQRINFLIGIYEPFIKQIRDGIFDCIPEERIKCFNSNELELILNGRPFIDVEEWQSFTAYKPPYNKDHKVIKWFWEILSQLPQKELSNLLLFASGATRVPLGGFAVLESSKGYLSQFTIDYVDYNKRVKNFIHAHTCFNRIDLPCFPNKNELEEAIHFVSTKEMWGFGIE
jgi:hypothetical protein